jgi:hypothetical protein
VQDFGQPDDPDAVRDPAKATPDAVEPPPPAAPARRGRGRPPGSRSRKNGATPTLAVN